MSTRSGGMAGGERGDRGGRGFTRTCKKQTRGAGCPAPLAALNAARRVSVEDHQAEAGRRLARDRRRPFALREDRDRVAERTSDHRRQDRAVGVDGRAVHDHRVLALVHAVDARDPRAAARIALRTLRTHRTPQTLSTRRARGTGVALVAFVALGAGHTRIALVAFVALGAGHTCIALVTLVALFALRTGDARVTLVALQTLRACHARIALVALLALETLRTRGAGRTLITLVALGAGDLPLVGEEVTDDVDDEVDAALLRGEREHLVAQNHTRFIHGMLAGAQRDLRQVVGRLLVLARGQPHSHRAEGLRRTRTGRPDARGHSDRLGRDLLVAGVRPVSGAQLAGRPVGAALARRVGRAAPLVRIVVGFERADEAARHDLLEDRRAV